MRFYFEAFLFSLSLCGNSLCKTSQTNEHAGMWCISGLISSASLSWRCLALSKLHREILDDLSTHLDVLVFCFFFFLNSANESCAFTDTHILFNFAS